VAWILELDHHEEQVLKQRVY